MSKTCPNCHLLNEDDSTHCYNCGTFLIDNLDTSSKLNLGDGNAICGGINVNQSKNITSHDMHYHSTTIHERAKSDSELKLEATNQLRCKAEEIITERGRIDSVAMSQLRPFAYQLGIDDETFKSIIKDVRSNRNRGNLGLSTADSRYLLHAQQAIQTNDMDGLSNLTTRLEAMAAISQDDNVQYLYYLTLSLLHPIKSMEVYELQIDENYWRSFWAIISYIRVGKYTEATKVLALFDPVRFEKSEEDRNLLEAYFHLMQDNKDLAQDFLDDILDEPSVQLKSLLRAIETALYEEESSSLEVKFYKERVLSKSDPSIKASENINVPILVEEAREVEPIAKEKRTQQKDKGYLANKQSSTSDSNAESLYAEACTASGPKRVMLLQKAADAGSLDAMYDLGDCYYDGEGVGKNMNLAIKWITKAADLGLLKAQAAIGVLYMTGAEGHEQNYAISEKYLTMAAERDFPKAQLALSYLYVGMEEYEKALIWARKAAELENEAYGVLGQIFSEGLGVEQDISKGIEFYEKAAKGGDADAQNIVGNYYFNGDDIEQNLAKAFNYYQMAAAQNHVYGMLNLGLCYKDGNGCVPDLIKAFEWIEKAANEGCPEAYSILGELYLNGLGIKSNPIEALTWYEKAAERGDADAQNIVGNICSNQELNVLDLNKAFKYYQMAATQNHMYGMFNFGLCYVAGEGCEVDMSKAIEWIEKAADKGCLEAKEWLATPYEEEQPNTVNNDNNQTDSEPSLSGMTPDDEIDYANKALTNNDLSKAKECLEILKKYANIDNPRAQFNLALCYHLGYGIKQNYQVAANWFKKAANQEFTNAQFMLGLKYEEGHGCGVNYQEAAKWYRKAAAQGDAESQFRLGLFYIEGNGVVMNKSKGLDLIQKASKQGHHDAANWLEDKAVNLNTNTEPNITIENVWIDTDNVGLLFIHCDWVVNNMKGDCLQFRVNVHAKTGKLIKFDASANQWYYLEDKFKVKNDSCRFRNTCLAISEMDFNMAHDEEKVVEFNIEVFKWGTDECLYSSRKMKFTVWYYFSFFKKNKFEIRSQQCLP